MRKYTYEVREYFGMDLRSSFPCDTWERAQIEAGKILDNAPYLPDTHFEIRRIESLDGNIKRAQIMTPEEFIDTPNPEITTHIPNVNFDVALEDKPESGHVLDKEPFHHLDEAETREVLMYTETGYILGELARRLEEYGVFVKKIEDALSTLDINA